MKRWLLTPSVLTAAILVLAACGDPTKEEIVEESRGISERAALQDKLGDPDDISKVGPVERWVYKASNGEVVFVITGDSVALQAAGGGN